MDKPEKGLVKLTIYFDKDEQAEEFMGWLSNSGEQSFYDAENMSVDYENDEYTNFYYDWWDDTHTDINNRYIIGKLKNE